MVTILLIAVCYAVGLAVHYRWYARMASLRSRSMSRVTTGVDISLPFRRASTFSLFSINSLDCTSVQSVSAPRAAKEALMPKRSAKPAPRCAEQPGVAAILKILSRPRGATVAEIEGSRPAHAHGALGRQPARFEGGA